jgi:hypothetical protein
MNVLSILCQRCGAPLQIADEGVRFVTCAHCSTPLEIVREQTQAHSRILEQIQAATTDNSKTLRLIALQNELERMDREWEENEDLFRGSRLSLHEKSNNVLMTLVIGAGSIFSVCFAMAGGNSSWFFIALAGAGVCYFSVRGYRQATREIREIERLETAHHQRRQELIFAIDAAKHEAL